MQCHVLEPHFAAFIDGELEQSLRVEIEAHLRACRACRETVRDLRVASAVLRKWKPAGPTVSLVEVIRRRLAEEARERGEELPAREAEVARPRRAAPRVFVARHAFALAAAVLLVVGVTLALIPWSTRHEERSPERAMLDLSGVASKVQAPAELRETAIALGGVVRDQWASAKPEPSVIVQLEVVENMMSTAKSADQRGDVSTILRLMGSRSLSARLGRGVGEAAEAARVTLLALMSMNAAGAEEAAPQASAALRDAEKLEASGDLEGALEKYRLAAQSPGIGATALIHQADLSLKLGRPSEAYDLLDRARAFSKSGTFSRELIEEMALRAERASELKVRIDELKSQVIAAKDPYAALMELGGLQLKAGNLKGARESFADVARRFPGLKSLRARLNGAWCDENLGRRQAAFEECNRLIAEAKGVDPAVVTLAQFERARILHLEQRFVQAIDEYRDLAAAAAAVNADAQAALYFQVGYIYLNDLGDADQAFNTFKSLKTDRYRNSPFGQLAGQILAESGK